MVGAVVSKVIFRVAPVVELPTASVIVTEAVWVPSTKRTGVAEPSFPSQVWLTSVSAEALPVKVRVLPVPPTSVMVMV